MSAGVTFDAPAETVNVGRGDLTAAKRNADAFRQSLAESHPNSTVFAGASKVTPALIVNLLVLLLRRVRRPVGVHASVFFLASRYATHRNPIRADVLRP